MDSTPLTLGYWGNVKGFGEPARILLEYTGIPYTEKHYDFLTKREEWFDGDKKTLGFDFPNLPYIIDGSKKVSESEALIHYIIKKSKKTELLGKDDDEETLLITLKGVAADIRKDVVAVLVTPEADPTKLAELKAKFDAKLDQLEKFIGSKKFFTGDKVTVFDLTFYNLINTIVAAKPDYLDTRPGLKQYKANVEALPQLQAYFNSDKYKNTPIFLPKKQ